MSANVSANPPPSAPMLESHLTSLQRVHQGKVRDIYALDDGDAGEGRMLIVTTDRLSAFDVVLPQPIPGKGSVLTRISRFWFDKTRHLIPNHLTGIPLDHIVPDAAERAAIADRSMVVRKLRALPVEAVVRGYLIGSGWKDYQQTGKICEIVLPTGLQQAARLPSPIFTPTTKAPMGAHDESVSFEAVTKLIGADLAEKVRAAALSLYSFAAAYALERGIIIADTKFEFGVDDAGTLTLIDEALTPDSSRFWPLDTYRPGMSPPSFDKQFVRDYLETLDWNKRAPAPQLPAEILAKTAAKYNEALRRLTQ
jgi:phosphoribosylaminoimidazole-succinocarboxamide synthase